MSFFRKLKNLLKSITFDANHLYRINNGEIVLCNISKEIDINYIEVVLINDKNEFCKHITHKKNIFPLLGDVNNSIRCWAYILAAEKEAHNV